MSAPIRLLFNLNLTLVDSPFYRLLREIKWTLQLHCSILETFYRYSLSLIA